MVSMLPLVLFTGKDVMVELHRGTTVLSIEDGWIMFSVEAHQVISNPAFVILVVEVN